MIFTGGHHIFLADSQFLLAFVFFLLLKVPGCACIWDIMCGSWKKDLACAVSKDEMMGRRNAQVFPVQAHAARMIPEKFRKMKNYGDVCLGYHHPLKTKMWQSEFGDGSRNDDPVFFQSFGSSD